MANVQMIKGIIETLLYFGLSGPSIGNNSGVLEVKNHAGSAFAKIRADHPVDNNDLTTLTSAWKFQKALPIGAQADCSSALPNNTASRRILVVTTAGNGTSLGDLLYDNGTSSGTMEIITGVEGQLIIATADLTGGTVELADNTGYINIGGTWTKVFDSSSSSDGVQVIRLVTGTNASYTSTTLIPANARIVRASFEVGTPYTGGTTIDVGISGDTDLFIDQTDLVSTEANTYMVPQDTSVGVSAAALVVTIGGSPVAGAGVAIIEYVNVLS